MSSHSFPSSFLLAIIKLLILFSLATNAAARADLKKFFGDRREIFNTWKRYDTSTDDRSGCKKYEAVLQRSWTEAADLVDAALKKIKNLEQAEPDDLADQREKWRWMVAAQSMKAFFNIEINPNTGKPIPADADRFRYVKDLYVQMKTGFDRDESKLIDGNNRYPYLLCGDESWTWTGPNDPQPDRPGRAPLSDLMNSANNGPQWPKGAFYYEGTYFYTKPKQIPNTNPPKFELGWCDANTAAYTVSRDKLHMMTWCDHGLTVLNPAIDRSIDLAGKPLDDQKALEPLSHTWVHELAHYYGLYPRREVDDKPALRSDGTPEPGKLTYGISRVIYLASYKPDDVVRTAESYAYFALAMYLDEYNFSTGTGKKFPD